MLFHRPDVQQDWSKGGAEENSTQAFLIQRRRGTGEKPKHQQTLDYVAGEKGEGGEKSESVVLRGDEHS